MENKRREIIEDLNTVKEVLDIQKECEHEYSVWELHQDEKVNYEYINGKKYNNVKLEISWSRTCLNCGYVQTVYTKPQELIEKEELERRQCVLKMYNELR